MRRPPPLQRIWEFPVSGGTCLLAIGVSLAGWSGKIDPDALVIGYRAWHDQPWRLVTGDFYHVNAFHLIFDVYWTWVFGAIVEEAFGSLAMAGLALLLAAGSGAAEFAFSTGGVGLSGLAYGLFGFLWVLGRYVPRFRDVVDSNTAGLFVVWFFLCIILTAADVMPIGNIAHGAGALLGGLVGFVIAFRGQRRFAAVAALVAALGVTVACATVLRPRVNFSVNAAQEEFQLGYDALVTGDNLEAAKYLKRVVSFRKSSAVEWYDLGIAYERLGRVFEARDAYQHALALDPTSDDYRRAVASVEKPED